MENQTINREPVPVNDRNISPPSPEQHPPATAPVVKEPEQFLWIKNEGLLRDEGTLFGIANADVADKIKAIEEYYAILNASGNQLVTRIDDSLLKNREEQDEQASALLSVSSPAGPATFLQTFFPVAIHLLLYLCVCVFNYYLVSYWLLPVVNEPFIILGIYFFGISGLFAGKSILYNHTDEIVSGRDGTDKREKWKVYLEEFGIPLVTAAAIVAFAWDVHPPVRSVFVALLLFFLFLFTGKGAISLFYRVRKEFAVFFREIKQALRMIARRKGIRRSIRKLKRSALKLEIELQDTKANVEKINAEREYRIRLFMSEYNLAARSREQGVEPAFIQK